LNHKASVLLLVPLVAFMAMPLAAVTAGSTTTSSTHTTNTGSVSLFVSCASSDNAGQAGASISFDGHQLILLCASNQAETERYMCINANVAPMNYQITTYAGGLQGHQKGTFGGFDYGGIWGEQLSPGGHAWAYWSMSQPCDE